MEKFAENTSFRLPDQFQYCMLSQCPINSSCLRYQAFLDAPDDMQYFSVLNPAYLLKQDLTDCNQYYSQTLKIFVAGLNGIMENLPLRKVQAIRTGMINLFGRSTYYRFMRKDKWLNPDEQQKVRELFENFGMLDELTYDDERKGF